MGDQYTFKVNADSARGIDEYLEYRRIVGDDDGGKLFTPEEYEKYKKEKIPQRMKNRLFVTWTNPEGMDCICVGPETECFCQHRYKQHKTDFAKIPDPRDLPCQVSKCKCASYHYAVKNGGQPVRCHCKHQTPDHAEVEPYICRQRNCKCLGFKTSFSCDCGFPAHQHHTVIETAPEREARGHPVGQATPYKAMGGLTGFSSLAAGYERLDPSGMGAPSEEFLNQAITSDDHPFLRGNLQAIKAHKMANNDLAGAMVDQEERAAQMRKEGESELDYYERRYQEKEKRRAGGGANRSLAAPSNPVQTGKRTPSPKPEGQGKGRGKLH